MALKRKSFEFIRYCVNLPKAVQRPSYVSALWGQSLALRGMPEDQCSFNFGKRKLSLGHREVIRRKRLDMLSDGVILLHDNTGTELQNSRIAAKVQVGSLEPLPYSAESASNLVSSTYLPSRVKKVGPALR
ncbi:hypothetical protein AVEN_249813-1 [Araneus ventricosus]|uniref:Uncharacterized protein n=1 Tax=Araneus ventricosus TaxID=182803 RepID=A0A4Y2WBF5_ARAVE|nr:hypothetical protein AVEN_249813-1 [Araneus ventricosus]